MSTFMMWRLWRFVATYDHFRDFVTNYFRHLESTNSLSRVRAGYGKMVQGALKKSKGLPAEKKSVHSHSHRKSKITFMADIRC